MNKSNGRKETRSKGRILRAILYNCGLLAEKTYDGAQEVGDGLEDAIKKKGTITMLRGIKKVVEKLNEDHSSDVTYNDMLWETQHAILRDCDHLLEKANG